MRSVDEIIAEVTGANASALSRQEGVVGKHFPDVLYASNGAVKDAIVRLLPELVEAALREATPSPTRHWVQAFAEQMEARLAENRHKGDRPGWLQQAPALHVEAALRHANRLGAAVQRGTSPDMVCALASDAANRLMMAADTYAENQRKDSAE
jgi:hypothetical protein